MIVNAGVFVLLFLVPLFSYVAYLGKREDDDEKLGIGISFMVISLIVTIILFCAEVSLDLGKVIQFKHEAPCHERPNIDYKKVQIDYSKLASEVMKIDK